ncbi:MAG: thioredoxin [Alphaproteobacteria bacterium]|nr:thioredoxin [Alphaproteobacteria bacterium]
MATLDYVTDDNFEAQVLNSELPVLLDFTATWCQPCKKLAPKVEELADEMSGSLRVFKVDVDQSQKLAMRYNVRSVPTLLVFNKGQVKGSIMGNVPMGKIQNLVEKAHQ